MPEDPAPTFASQTTEALMQLQELISRLKTLTKSIKEDEAPSEGIIFMIDTYESTIDTLFKMLVRSNEHILGQDEMLNTLFAKIQALK